MREKHVCFFEVGISVDSISTYFYKHSVIYGNTKLKYFEMPLQSLIGENARILKQEMPEVDLSTYRQSHHHTKRENSPAPILFTFRIKGMTGHCTTNPLIGCSSLRACFNS